MGQKSLRHFLGGCDIVRVAGPEFRPVEQKALASRYSGYVQGQSEGTVSFIGSTEMGAFEEKKKV